LAAGNPPTVNESALALVRSIVAVAVKPLAPVMVYLAEFSVIPPLSESCAPIEPVGSFVEPPVPGAPTAPPWFEPVAPLEHAAAHAPRAKRPIAETLCIESFIDLLRKVVSSKRTSA
jgi:hypothetical protein